MSLEANPAACEGLSSGRMPPGAPESGTTWSQLSGTGREPPRSSGAMSAGLRAKRV